MDKRRCHLVSWDSICKPKADGGLGFRNLRMLNEGYMMKLGWRMIVETESLWTKVLRAKYACGENDIPVVRVPSKAFHIWRGLTQN